MVNHPLKWLKTSVMLLTLATVPALLPAQLLIPAARSQTEQTASTSLLPPSLLPASIPKGATIRISSSPSLDSVNQALKKELENKYPGTPVELTTVSSDEAIQSLLDGKTNLAAIGRPLTAQEQGRGLVLAPVKREKIAIIIGPNNPFRQNLTFAQFAQIFRGEITDWSQLGGKAGKIRLIDRPESNDARRALSGYKVFQSKPFQTGATATQLAQDDTNAIAKELGSDGISYAPADQVLALKTVRIVPMHNTLPGDSRYPYSHVRGYVYKKGQSLFVVAAPAPGTSTPAPGTATPASGTSTSAPAATTAETAQAPLIQSEPKGGGFPLWLLGIGVLGAGAGLFWFLRKGSGETAAPPPVEPIAPVPSPIETPEPIAPAVPPVVPPVVSSEAAIAPEIEPVVAPEPELESYLPLVSPVPLVPPFSPEARVFPKGELTVKADWGNDDEEINALPGFTNPLPERVTAQIEAEGLWSYGAPDGVHLFEKLVDGDGNLEMAEKERQENHLRFTDWPPAILVALKNGQYVASGKGPYEVTLDPGDRLSFVMNDEPHYYKDNKGDLLVKWAIVDAQQEV